MKNSISSNTSDLSNFGIEQNFFDFANQESHKDKLYVIKKDKLRKVYSGNDIEEIGVGATSDLLSLKRNRELEDIELYGDKKGAYFEEVDKNTNRFVVTSVVGENTCLNSSNNNNNYSNSNTENNIQLNHDEVNKTTRNNTNINNKIKAVISSKTNFTIDTSNLQVQKLNVLVSNINNEVEDSDVKIKAYKSKLKRKFYDLYVENSEKYSELNKHRVFHKCSFPGCVRTFSSSGWLKSHLNDHIVEMKNNRFNIRFNEFLKKTEQLNIVE